jgi:hypothetical protein
MNLTQPLISRPQADKVFYSWPFLFSPWEYPMQRLFLTGCLFVIALLAAPSQMFADDAKIKENLLKLSEADRKLAELQKICPIEEELLGSHGVPIKLTIKDKPVFICCKGCKEDAEKKPDETLKKVADLIKKNQKK